MMAKHLRMYLFFEGSIFEVCIRAASFSGDVEKHQLFARDVFFKVRPIFLAGSESKKHQDIPRAFKTSSVSRIVSACAKLE